MRRQRTQRKSKGGSDERYPLRHLTERIIGYALEVHSHLGQGLLESLYEEAPAYEFDLKGVKYERQKEVGLVYKTRQIGNHRIDFFGGGRGNLGTESGSEPKYGS